MRDFDGDPISQNYNYEGLKKRPKHHVKMGSKRKGHKAYKGNRPKHEPKMGEQ